MLEVEGNSFSFFVEVIYLYIMETIKYHANDKPCNHVTTL